MKKLLLMLVVVGVLIGAGCCCCFPGEKPKGSKKRHTQNKAVCSGMLQGIRTFLAVHPEFGTPSSVQNVPDWAQGKRQRVRFTNSRTLLFYLKNGSIISIYENNPTRKKIWGN